MKLAVLYVDTPYLKNEIFNEHSKLNRDDCLKFYRLLKNNLLEKNINLVTQDMCREEEAEFVFFGDIPKSKSVVAKYAHCKKRVAILYESEVIKPWNFDLSRHKDFDVIFTWMDDLIDNKKYFKFNYSFDLEKIRNGKHSGFYKYDLVLFCGNQHSNHKNAIYHLRKNLISWFEKSSIQIKFHFWGGGWDQDFKFYIPEAARLRRFIKWKFLFHHYKNYQGYAKDKNEILSQAKFNFCIENATGFQGYITEKIFDSFQARCVPIYMGPSNIDNFIPNDCYINYNHFNSIDEFLKFLPKIDLAKIRAKIDSYLNSDTVIQFSNEFVAERISQIVLKNEN